MNHRICTIVLAFVMLLGLSACGGGGGGGGAAATPIATTPATASVKTLAAGFYHSCARLDNGTIKCWGINDSGQLGLGDSNDRGDNAGEMGDALPAVNLGTGRSVVELVSGSDFTCARLDNSKVKCWGNNYSGRLGLGDTVDRGDNAGQMGDALPAVNLGTGRTAIELAASGGHTCARLDNGTVKCWGSNYSGQLGLGDVNHRGDVAGELGDALPAVNLGTGRSVVELATGGSHNCARLDNGTIKCWGENFSGQLGLGDVNNRGDTAGEMGDALPTVNLGSGRTAIELVASVRHTCARLDNGTVKCWGENNYGQLGLGDTITRGDNTGEMGDALPTVNLGSGRTAVDLTAGFEHTCARLDNGTVKCWGRNLGGKLGLGDSSARGDVAGEMGDALPAVNFGTGRSVVELATGGSHNCARLDNGTIKCWGENFSGQLGLGDVNNRGDTAGEMGDALPAVELGDKKLAAGADHNCVRLDNGTIKCWGTNNSGQLGLGDVSNRGDNAGEMGDALPVVNLGIGRTVVELVTGDERTCTRLDNGAVKCWGRNNLGQLGLGDTITRGDNAGEMGDALPAVNLGTGRTVVELVTGGDHTCARLDNGTVKCWGSNASGQLGLGDINPRGDVAGEMGDALPAVNFGAGRTAIDLAASGGHTCARLDNGTVKCWGNNFSGQLGLGDTITRGDTAGEMGDALPVVNLGTGRRAIEMVVGYNLTCARLDNGMVKCWGLNGFGQLGLGNTVNRGDDAGEMGDALPAIDLGTGRTAVELVAGIYHTCARLDNGMVKCWGRNNFGQLGLGDTINRGDNAGEMGNALPAVNLGTGRTAVELVAGTSNTCARLDNGTTKCWGINFDGQLGLGDVNARGDAAGDMGDALPAVDLGTL